MMRDKKKQFRFKIPWLSGSRTPPPSLVLESHEKFPSHPSHDNDTLSLSHLPSSPHENGSESLKVISKELESAQGKTHPSDGAKGSANGIKHGESIHRSEQAKDASTRAPPSDHRIQKEERHSVERKMMFAASSSPAAMNVRKMPLQPNMEDRIPLHEGIKDDISNLVGKVASVSQTQPMDGNSLSVVTLAGENRGAAMHVGSDSAKKEGSIHIHRAYKNKSHSSEEESTGESTDSEEVGKAYVNSNVQSVNNSLMLHGSVSGRDPGVRLLLLPQQQHQHQADPIKNPSETRGAAQKMGYQPVIRRRCLRGMLLEPSDDEIDNPNKPRRHGCKVRCGSEIM